MSQFEEIDITIPSRTREGMRVQRQLLEQLEQFRYPNRDVLAVRLATEEAIVNAIKHGNSKDPDKTLRVWWKIDSNHVTIRIEDEGAGFDVNSVPDPCLQENLERPSGRGIMLMRRYMSSVEYLDDGRTLVLEKHRTAS